ncbi:MAG: Glutamine--fructose-6-phosphate aminotransferase [isomerizing] [Candidatus Anoxychlamydiales bacterium]|nr:Glutamine--fructose-6-phosphate aminotransferase [isomerizing] [Candidatus Anoxychlamydiales bacterium]
MCGIFAYLGSKSSIKECLSGLKLLEYRGYDSAGIAAIKNNKLIHFKASGKIKALEKKINLKNLKLDLAIGHTRWATHGSANEKNAHPHFDENQNIAIVHNGIIENFDILKRSLISKNYKFRSDTDTEVIAHLISSNYKGNLIEATLKSLKELKGSFAIAMIHKNHPNELIAASRESPLAIGFNDKKTEVIISSDPNAFSGRNLNVIFLKNDEIAHIKNQEIKVINFKNKTLQKTSEKINAKNIKFSKKGFEHFMLKEIFDQPSTIQKAYLGRILENKGQVEFEDLKLSKSFLSKIDNIIITACGTSHHAALIAKSLIEENANIPVSTEIASEMRFKTPILTKNTLVIAISQSGETADTIAAIKTTKEKGAKILSIVNVENSSLSRISDSSIFLKAGIERSVCSTKAFSSQITVLYLFAIYLARLRSMQKNRATLLLNELKKIPSKVRKILKNTSIIEEKAKKYSKYDNFFFLGRNLMYPTAMEAALKLKEISYLHASAYPAGEMKHGPLALIDSKLAIIAFCSNKKTYDKMLSSLMEARARNAKILAFATKGSYGIEDIADDVIWLDNTIDELSIFPSTIAAQLFAYFIAKIRKTDIDQPRNLAKSVTVE